MNTEPRISNVSDTSFWVAYYRAKETDRPDALFRDFFAEKLVGTRGKQISDAMGAISRFTEWSVVSRTVIIDRFLEQSFKDGVDTVINLGAGLDARPYRMNLPANLKWIEVDYPHIIDHKNNVLASDVPKCDLSRVAVDLANGEKRKAFLDGAALHAKKVLILTEGVIPYLNPDQVGELASDLFSQHRFSLWITEYFHPRVYPYLKKTVRQLKMKNAPFKFYPKDWFGFFKIHGWEEKQTRYTGEIATEFGRKMPMPRWVEFLFPIIWPILPKKLKEQGLRMTGYTVLKRAMFKL